MAHSALNSAGLTNREHDAFDGTPYRMVRRLGSGGMSDVFIVEHRELEKEFVAKVLRAELSKDAQTLDRVRIEAQALGRLNHPNVVSVSDVRSLGDGRPFIVMEHLRGRSLADELSIRKPLPAREALRYAGELLAALSAVHALGIVHRDIKPSNLFLCDLPNRRRVLKVLDFGVARVLPGAPASAPSPLSVPTATGAVVGTPRYISPEGAAGEHVDHRADLYAAALVLYTMLTGRGPFDHLRPSDLLAVRESVDPEPPSRIVRDSISPELDALILKALRRDPAERFQSAEEFKKALEAVERLPGPPSDRAKADEPHRPKEALEAFDTTQAAETIAEPGNENAAEMVTRTALPQKQPAPRAEPPQPSLIVKRLAAMGAFLLVTLVTFAVGVGLVRALQAYLEKG